VSRRLPWAACVSCIRGAYSWLDNTQVPDGYPQLSKFHRACPTQAGAMLASVRELLHGRTNPCRCTHPHLRSSAPACTRLHTRPGWVRAWGLALHEPCPLCRHTCCRCCWECGGREHAASGILVLLPQAAGPPPRGPAQGQPVRGLGVGGRLSQPLSHADSSRPPQSSRIPVVCVCTPAQHTRYRQHNCTGPSRGQAHQQGANSTAVCLQQLQAAASPGCPSAGGCWRSPILCCSGAQESQAAVQPCNSHTAGRIVGCAWFR
jgi:hypothetical protein